MNLLFDKIVSLGAVYTGYSKILSLLLHDELYPEAIKMGTIFFLFNFVTEKLKSETRN